MNIKFIQRLVIKHIQQTVAVKNFMFYFGN